ncbi:MAG: polyprenol monophosphomannose synthase [Acidimicrobiales bacterium]
MRVLVVLPTYNEHENIEAMLATVRGVVPDASILVVDDSSPDGTAEIAERAAGELGSIEVLRRPAKTGLGPAYRDGFRWGLDRGYEAFVEMDSDFSHDPGALPELLAALGDGVELVVGSRYVPGGSIPNWSISRRLISRLGNVYAKALLGLGVEDSTAGYRVYAATLLRRLDLARVRADSYGFQIEMTHLARGAGAGIVEVPIHFVDRVAGTSKMSTFTVVEAFVLVTGWGLQRLLRPGRVRRTRSAAVRTTG